MKNLISLLLIIISITFASSERHIIPNLLISKEEAKQKLIKELKKLGNKDLFINYPEDYEKYVTDLTSSTSVIFDKILFSEIDSLRRTHNFPEKIILQFKSIKYSNSHVGYENFNYYNEKTKTKIENVFGIATRLDEKFLYFAYIKGDTSGKVIYQYNVIPYEDCHWILFIKSCKTKHRYERRGFTLAELEIIQKSLIAKFYQNLHSILNLNANKVLEKFKEYANYNRQAFPKYYEKYFPIFQTFLNHHTISLATETYQIDALKHRGFDLETRDRIVELIDKPGHQVNTFQILQCGPNECSLRMGIAYAVDLRFILFHYIEGVSISKNYDDYCVNYRGGFLGGSFIEEVQKCKDDPECVSACNKYRKNVRDPYNPINEIPDLNNNNKEYQFNMNSKKILIAAITNKIADVLNNIKF